MKARMYMLRERKRAGLVNLKLYLSSFWNPFMYSGTGHPACCMTLAMLQEVPTHINLYLIKLMFMNLNPLYKRD